MNAISFWTGIVGGVAGIVGGTAGLLALYDRFWHRKPRLNAVAPCCFSGLDGPAKHPVLNIYLRIANRAKASAFLYLETMLVKVFFEGRWHETPRADLASDAKLMTDLPREVQVVLGVAEAAVLSKFGNSLVTFEQPLCGYIFVIHEDLRVLKGCTKISISVEDCHSFRHTMTVDLPEQKRPGEVKGK